MDKFSPLSSNMLAPKCVYPAPALNRSLPLELTLFPYIKNWPHTIIIGHSKSLSERLANIMGFNFAGVNRMKRDAYSSLCVYSVCACACASACECAFWVLYSLVALCLHRMVHTAHQLILLLAASFVCLKSNATLPLRYATITAATAFWHLVFSL